MAEISGPNPAEPIFFCQSEAKTVADDEHNSEEKLRNSSDTCDADDEQSEEQKEESTYVVDVGDPTPTYYHRDEDGELHGYEFLPEELVYPDGFFSEEELRKAAKMKRIEADLDIVNVVRTPEEAKEGVTIPASQPGEAGDLRVLLSTELGDSSYTTVAKRARQLLSDNDDTAISEDRRRSRGVTSADLSRSEDVEAPSTLSSTRSDLDKYVSHRSEGLADKSQDWIKRAPQALWERPARDIADEYDRSKDICS
jgi:hypothetical protein